MYEANTYELIKQRLLDLITYVIEKREGSFVNNMISPVAAELAQGYVSMDEMLKILFAQTTYGEYLDKRAGEFGITRKLGQKATTTSYKFTGVDGTVIPSGTAVKTPGGLKYFTKASTTITSGIAVVEIEAENIGAVYNVPANTITVLPISIAGVLTVTNTTSLTNGVDVETDEEFLERFLTQVRNPATSGNASHYKIWATEITGCGDALVVPTWNGAGTVKVIIVNQNKAQADANLITEVADHIEANRPIGAAVTVTTVTPKNITILATITLKAGHILNDVKNAFQKAVIDYFKDITFEQAYVSYAKIGSLLLETEGVTDYSSFTVNGGTTNVTIAQSEAPTLSTVTLSV